MGSFKDADIISWEEEKRRAKERKQRFYQENKEINELLTKLKKCADNNKNLLKIKNKLKSTLTILQANRMDLESELRERQ
jgi:hypothetical protein